MSPIYVPGKVVLAQTYVGIDDPDAAAYITAVETADGQSLETAVKIAIHSFVKGCKADGIWPAIKASCILAGARTLTGALLPLVGTAPTNFNFVTGDYNRKTGLVGNGSTKYLDSNRAENAAGTQDNVHTCAWISSAFGLAQYILYGTDSTSATGLFRRSAGGGSTYAAYSRASTLIAESAASTGFMGVSRSSSTNVSSRIFGVTASSAQASSAAHATNFHVFGSPSPTTNRGNGRLAFYSIGESLNLALLDARVTTLINAFAAAIP
jgi:hypothetical protein